MRERERERERKRERERCLQAYYRVKATECHQNLALGTIKKNISYSKHELEQSETKVRYSSYF